MNKKLKILGIDPGYGRTGWGMIEDQGNRLGLLEYGCIETNDKLEFVDRLELIYHQMELILKKYQPDLVAVEELFFCKNSTTAIKVGQARGVVLLVAKLAGAQVVEYTPLQVKQAIVSYGKAEKKQVQDMVKIFLGLKSIPKPDDAADALAIAICASNSYKLKNFYGKA